MPTSGTFIQLLPKGFKTARYRATDATVFTAVEGKGRSRIGEQVFEWGPRDLFVVLLSNRVDPTRNNTRIGGVRIALADSIVSAVDRARR